MRVAGALLALASLTACQGVPTIPAPPGVTASPESTKAANKPASVKNAAAALAKLKVAPPGSMRGYSRAKFPTWRETGPNCNVRDAVLKRDGTHVKTSGCNVVAGTWRSAYDGMVLNSPTKVDIDHLVPLADAWRSGAANWTTARREDFANDLDHPELRAVSITANRAKGDQDPTTWRPKETSLWCEYAEDWITVKTAWKLTVTAGEKAALADMLETC